MESNAGVPEHYIFDQVLGPAELLWIYHELLATNSWTLSRASIAGAAANRPFSSFPGLIVENRGGQRHDFLAGYFRGVVFRIRELARRHHGLVLPPEIRRIHIGAKSSQSKTDFHTDTDESGVWTILGFLNPVWNAADGGEFFLEDHKLPYRSGGFVVFPSNIRHDGGYVRNEALNYWRISLNVMLAHG